MQGRNNAPGMEQRPSAPHLGDVGVLGWLRLLVHGNVVAGHALLGDQHLLAAVHDEIAALRSRMRVSATLRRVLLLELALPDG